MIWSWLSPLGSHTEALPTSRSIEFSNGGEDGDMTSRGDNLGDNGGGRECEVKEGVRSEETFNCREGWGEGETRVGESGGGRDGGGGLEEKERGTEGGSVERDRGGLETGGKGGQEGRWEGFTIEVGGLGRHGRAGGRDEGKEGGQRIGDGGMESIEGTAGGSSSPARVVLWLSRGKRVNGQQCK